uniref:LuxR C-terminal-related transcriptional regulator n=1 Tax=Altererythrobacter segetis TaxID=1104773 RepID=UPI00140C4FE0
MSLDSQRRVSLSLIADLTVVERQILCALVQGRSIKSIATMLSLPLQSVVSDRDALLEKLSARTVADAVRIGLLAGMQ